MFVYSSFVRWNHRMFRQMAILSGCDYLESIPSMQRAWGTHKVSFLHYLSLHAQVWGWNVPTLWFAKTKLLKRSPAFKYTDLSSTKINYFCPQALRRLRFEGKHSVPVCCTFCCTPSNFKLSKYAKMILTCVDLFLPDLAHLLCSRTITRKGSGVQSWRFCTNGFTTLSSE